MAKRLSIRDIAQLAGVSPAAVSFALNNREGISPQTRKKILDIVEHTGYDPASSMLKPARGRSNNIAVITRSDINYIDQLFYSELNNSVMQACEGLPYNLVYAPAYCFNGHVMLPDIVRSEQVDGVLVYGDVEISILDALLALRLPIMVLDSSRYNDERVTSIFVDYEAAAYMATRYLIDLGHKDIAYIGNEDTHEFSVLTFNGFQRATMESALMLSTNRIQMSVYGESSLYAALDNALLGEQRPTAIFCTTDFSAIHTMRYLHSMGVRIPEDISVIGIDDLLLSRFTIPSLTTVNVDRESMGASGFQMLLEMINGNPRKSFMLPSCDLVVRESTCPPWR